MGADGSHVLSRTMDWHRLVAGPVFVPRNFRWQSDFDGISRTNRFAMLGTGRKRDFEIDISDGVNECGLSVQKLTFKNGAQLLDECDNDHICLAPFELPLYLLANFSSVADIETHIEEIRLLSGKNAVKDYGYPELHYVAADKTGRIVIIEPNRQPLKLQDNPLGVVTNAYDFKQQLKKLAGYLNFTPEFINQNISNDVSKISTGSFAGKKVPSSSYTPSGRFIRAAYYKERVDQPQNEEANIISSFHLLDSVSVPKSSAYQKTYSVYRSSFCLESLRYYFEPYNRISPVSLQLTRKMLDFEKPHFFIVKNELSEQKLKI
ncbi:penicillin V acylase related amidase [Liquorilactobacillus oeni DSM 19972]|uniref:Penicillin V acylase related amidase n=1 Tax=Liquorilactobacillus oeni DSM 19972 TaxID=1423777 RepID=A0A0R1M9Z2_9LACO|nr:penicillin V acylase related amidase [Liquorilactobacillus oeni DSM 19972]